jgi:hypothetical protein
VELINHEEVNQKKTFLIRKIEISPTKLGCNKIDTPKVYHVVDGKSITLVFTGKYLEGEPI